MTNQMGPFAVDRTDSHLVDTVAGEALVVELLEKLQKGYAPDDDMHLEVAGGTRTVGTDILADELKYSREVVDGAAGAAAEEAFEHTLGTLLDVVAD